MHRRKNEDTTKQVIILGGVAVHCCLCDHICDHNANI